MSVDHELKVLLGFYERKIMMTMKQYLDLAKSTAFLMKKLREKGIKMKDNNDKNPNIIYHEDFKKKHGILGIWLNELPSPPASQSEKYQLFVQFDSDIAGDGFSFSLYFGTVDDAKKQIDSISKSFSIWKPEDCCTITVNL